MYTKVYGLLYRQGVCQDHPPSIHNTLQPLYAECGRAKGHQQHQQHGEGHSARAGHCRGRSEQTQQTPESVNEYVTPENPVGGVPWGMGVERFKGLVRLSSRCSRANVWLCFS